MSTALLLALLLTAPAEAGDQVESQAKALTRRSMLEYDTGHYAEALSDVERAYEIDPLPALLFNLGQCHRALGHHRDAALAFKSYLREMPKARNRAQAAELYAQMSQLAERDAAAPAAAPNPTPLAPVAPPPNPPVASSAAPAAAVTASDEGGGHPIRASAWWVGGAGLGVGVVGGILFGVAESTLGSDHPVTLTNGTVEHQLSSGTFHSAATEANAGEVLWCVGGALLVTGVILALTGGSR